MMALLAGLGAGYLGYKEKERDNNRQDKRDAREEEIYQSQKADREQAKADKEALREAAAPVAVTEEQGPPTESQVAQATMEGRQPGAIGYRVGNGRTAKVFAERGVADKAASEQNTVDGTRTRTAAAMAAQGNVIGADQLRTSGLQATAAEIAIKESQQVAADKAVKRRIDGFKTPEDMALFMTESPADKEGGAFKARASYSPDKKTFTFDRVNDDGTFTPTGQTFENSPAGMEKAKMTLAGYMTPEQRLAHHQWEETKAEQARHNKTMEGVAQQNANTQEQYRKDQAAHLRETTARLTANAKAADAPPTWSKDADEHIVKLNTTKNTETNREELDGNGAQFMQAVALDVARKNGGNTMAAISRAAEVDAALKAMAKGDANMLVQLRAKALADASGRPAAPQAAAPTANATPTTAAPQPRPAVRPQAIAAQGFNEAGYTDVQSTIEGAKRGDKKALAYFFDVLVKRGETTPGQRQQMTNLMK